LREVKQGTFNFEKLDVWQEAIRFANIIYDVTRTFPEQERFGLTNQTRRAAVSVSSNLAEGSPRSSRLDFARFVEIATGSLFEVVSQGKDCIKSRTPDSRNLQQNFRSGRKTKPNAQRLAALAD
jgi:four helix bundle protein